METNYLNPWNQYRLLGVDDFPRTVNIYNYSVDLFLLGNKIDEITVNACVGSLKEVIESCLNIWKWYVTYNKWLYFRTYLGKRLVFTYLILIARIMNVIFLKIEVLF